MVVVVLTVVTRLAGGTSADRVTEAEARAFLARAVGLGLAGDYDALCAMNGSVANCRWTLETLVVHPPATTPPTSVTSRYIDAGKDNDTPGWVLTVRGLDGRGDPYDTEVMVFRDHEATLKATNVVWWSGARIGFGGGEEEAEAPPSE